MYIPVFPLILDASVPAVPPARVGAAVVRGPHADDAVGDVRGSSVELVVEHQTHSCTDILH